MVEVFVSMYLEILLDKRHRKNLNGHNFIPKEFFSPDLFRMRAKSPIFDLWIVNVIKLAFLALRYFHRVILFVPLSNKLVP